MQAPREQEKQKKSWIWKGIGALALVRASSAIAHVFVSLSVRTFCSSVAHTKQNQ